MQLAKLKYQNQEYDLAAPFKRLTFKQAIQQYNQELTLTDLEDVNILEKYIRSKNIELPDPKIGTN